MPKAPLRNLTIGIVVAAILAGAGIVYAHWGTSAVVAGHVVTGDVDSHWVEWSCGGAGVDDLTATAVGFVGPPEWVQLGSNPAFEVWDTGRDVANTVIESAMGPRVTDVVFRIDNAYPSHYEECEWEIGNVGSIPLAAPYAVIRALNSETTFASAIFAGDGVLWVASSDGIPATQINPQQRKSGSLRIHVEQIAAQDARYEFEIAFCLHNWNEPSTATDDVCGLYEPYDIVEGTVVLVAGT